MIEDKKEGIDFSNYNAPINHETTEVESAIQPLPTTQVKITKRLWIFGAILIILALVQVLIFVISRPADKTEIPAGYHIVQPKYGPVRVEKNTK
jgi:hypothetical protein